MINIDRIDFVRDVTAYMLVVALVIGVAYDGKVSRSVITPTYFIMMWCVRL